MTGSVSVVVGDARYTFHLDKGDDIAIINQMIVLGNPPMNCKAIKNGKYKLETNKDSQSNTYVNMMCYGKTETGEFQAWKAKLGTYKDKSGFFWNNFELDQYRTDAMNNKAGATAQPGTKADDVSEDIPF